MLLHALKHGDRTLTIPAIAYNKPHLIVRSVGGEGHFLWNYSIITEPIFKNFLSNGFSGETLRLRLNFSCNACIT